MTGLGVGFSIHGLAFLVVCQVLANPAAAQPPGWKRLNIALPMSGTVEPGDGQVQGLRALASGDVAGGEDSGKSAANNPIGPTPTTVKSKICDPLDLRSVRLAAAYRCHNSQLSSGSKVCRSNAGLTRLRASARLSV